LTAGNGNAIISSPTLAALGAGRIPLMDGPHQVERRRPLVPTVVELAQKAGS
jgi:hypothetical protein